MSVQDVYKSDWCSSVWTVRTMSLLHLYPTHQNEILIFPIHWSVIGVNVVGRMYEEVLPIMRARDGQPCVLTFVNKVRHIVRGLFGIPLQALLDLDGSAVPRLTTRCIEHLHEEGMFEKGLFSGGTIDHAVRSKRWLS